MNIYYLLIGCFLLSVFVLSINGINFSALFIVVLIWMSVLGYKLRLISRNTKKKEVSILSKVYTCLFSLLLISFLIIEGILTYNIANFKSIEEIENVDYILVLGAGLDGEKPGKVLTSRLEKAIEYHKKNEDTYIIVSGGVGEGKNISEAQAMYNYLIEQNINKDKILKEDKATTTLENFIFSKEILEARDDEDKKILIVTNEFHLYRAMIIADKLDIYNEGLACYTSIKTRVNYMIREYFTIIIDVMRIDLGIY